MPLTSSVEVVRGSICDTEIVRKALKEVLRVYLFGGQSDLWTAKKSELHRINFEGTQTIFAEVAKQDIEVIVYTSTESILSGNTRQYRLIDSAVERTLEKTPGLAVQNFSPNKKHLRRQKKDCQWWWRLHCQLDREIV